MQFLIFIALIPSLVIAFLIYRADKKEKEPIKEILKAFSMGVISIIFTLVISFILGITKIKLDTTDLGLIAFYAFISISLVEESCKWICSYIFLRKNKNFDYLFDGIVYTTFVSLGFATVENLLYTFTGGILTGVVRAITTVPAHAFFGIFSGYYISLSKKEKINLNEQLSKKYLFLSLLVPVLLHGFYDFCLLSKNYLFYLIYLVFMVCLYAISISNVKKMMKIETSLTKKKKMYCSNCGKRVEQKFCTNCGKKVDE